MDVNYIIENITHLQDYYSTLPSKSDPGPRLDDVKKNQRMSQLYEYFSNNRDKEHSTRDIAEKLGISVQVASATCRRLLEKDFIFLVRQVREGPVLYNSYKFKERKGKYD